MRNLIISLIICLLPSLATAKDFTKRLDNCEPYRETVVEILAQYDVPDYFYFLMVAESTCRLNTSPKGAQGFWQMMPPTQRHYGCDDYTDLVCQTHAAAKYLKHLLAMFEGDYDKVVHGYNQGGRNFIRRGKTKSSSALAYTVRTMHKQHQKK